MFVVATEGKYRYHAVKEPYPTEVLIDADFTYVDVGSVVVQNEYIFVQVWVLCRTPLISRLVWLTLSEVL